MLKHYEKCIKTENTCAGCFCQEEQAKDCLVLVCPRMSFNDDLQLNANVQRAILESFSSHRRSSQHQTFCSQSSQDRGRSEYNAPQSRRVASLSRECIRPALPARVRDVVRGKRQQPQGNSLKERASSSVDKLTRSGKHPTARSGPADKGALHVRDPQSIHRQVEAPPVDVPGGAVSDSTDHNCAPDFNDIERRIWEDCHISLSELGTCADIVGYQSVLKRLEEAIVLPLLVPEYFAGMRRPWKGVLLYGPPGTGKTSILRKVVLKCKHRISFLHVSSATLFSKYHGESEKFARALFTLARKSDKPTVVFIDEVDSVLSCRGKATEHEASRRFKSEILQQMDGIYGSTEAMNHVVIVGSTNLPWQLDNAALRRFEQRVYCGLPDTRCRAEIIETAMKEAKLPAEFSVEKLAELTAGFSGADVVCLCRNACMGPVRRLLSTMTVEEVQERKAHDLLPSVSETLTLSVDDVSEALSSTSRTVSDDEVDRFEQWRA